MKKIISIVAIIAIGFASCKKETDGFLQPISSGAGVSLKKDTTVLDSNIQPPQNAQTVFTGILDIGNSDGFVATGAKVSFTRIGDAAMPADYAKNVFFTISDGATPVYTSEAKTSIVNSENSFNQFAKNLLKGKSYIVNVYADILASATNGTGLVDACVINFELIYSDKNNAQNSIGFIAGQKITFSSTASLSISSALDISNPTGSVVLSNQEKNVLSYNVKVVGGAMNIIEHDFQVQGASASAVTTLKLYDGSTLIAQAPVVSGVANISASTLVPVNVTKVFTVKAVVAGVSSTISNSNFNVTLDVIKGQSVVTNDIRFDSSNRTGNDFTVLKAIPTVSASTVSTLMITNASMELYRYTVTATNGDISFKQFAFNINLNDQGVNDTLFLKNFQIFENGVDVTNLYHFTDESGFTDTLFSETNSKIYATRISGTGETVVPAGTIKTISFRATVGGFNHPSDGDGLSVQLANDVTPSVSLKYLNSGGVSNGNAKLYSSQTSNSAAQVFSFIWSDISSLSHNGLFVQTSNDWVNGQKVFADMLVNNFHQ